MTNEQLIRQYYDGDDAALEKLYYKNIGLIRGIAKEAAAEFNCLTADPHHPNQLSAYTKMILDDLCSEGALELLTRIQSREYDESRAALTTYLYPHLRGRMTRWLEQNIGCMALSKDEMAAVRQAQRLYHVARKDTGEIAEELGISQGSQPLVSYHYGKEDHTGCQKLLRYALTTVCIFAPALFLLVFFFAPQIVRTYLSHAGDELIAYSIGAFRRYSVSYLLLGFNIVIGGFMTAIERPVPAICISVGRGLALQSAVLLLLAAIFGGDAVWYTPIFSEALCLVMSLLFLRSYRRQTDMQA